MLPWAARCPARRLLAIPAQLPVNVHLPAHARHSMACPTAGNAARSVYYSITHPVVVGTSDESSLAAKIVNCLAGGKLSDGVTGARLLDLIVQAKNDLLKVPISRI